MNRESALKAIRENVKNENLIKHMLATEAIMRALARRFNPATCYSSAPAGGGKSCDPREVALFREPPAPVTSRSSATGGGSTENEDEWGLAGLLHDIDVELTHGDLKVHSKPGAEMAKQLGAGEAVCHAILVHNEAHGEPCVSLMDKALFCADPLTGLITAGALIRPDKKLASVEAKSIRKRFKEERFAAGVNREQIAKCSDISLELDDFIALGLDAMKSVAADLGL